VHQKLTGAPGIGLSLPDICIQTFALCRHKMSSENTLTTTLLVAQHSSVDMDQEYNNVCSWSTQNKLPITDKSKIIFTVLFLETVKQATLLGID